MSSLSLLASHILYTLAHWNLDASKNLLLHLRFQSIMLLGHQCKEVRQAFSFLTNLHIPLLKVFLIWITCNQLSSKLFYCYFVSNRTTIVLRSLALAIVFLPSLNPELQVHSTQCLSRPLNWTRQSRTDLKLKSSGRSRYCLTYTVLKQVSGLDVLPQNNLLELNQYDFHFFFTAVSD